MDYLNRLISLAIEEDSGLGDITTESLLSGEFKGKGVIVAKEPMVLAGLDVARAVFVFVDAKATVNTRYNNGDTVRTDDIVMSVSGDLAGLLRAERIALNFLQHLSGIATLTRTFVDALDAGNVRLVDTRKTTPGLRLLEKNAVRAGGAYNHRMSLYDGVLIKDNHIAVAGGVKNAIKSVRANVSHLMKIEVEVGDLAQVEAALEEGADVIMLDNMTIDQMKQAVALINKQALVEASGNVSLSRLSEIAATGVDVISSGALTHQARSMDLSMRITPAWQ